MNLVHIGVVFAIIAMAVIVWIEDRGDRHGVVENRKGTNMNNTYIRAALKVIGAAMTALGLKGLSDGDVNQAVDALMSILGAASTLWGIWLGIKNAAKKVE